MKYMMLFVGLSVMVAPAVFASDSADGAVRIAPTDPALIVTGARYATPCAEGLEFLRFSPATYEIPFSKLKANAIRARTTSGARLRFRTDAARAVASFTFRAGDENRGSQFGLYRDGVWVKEVSVAKETIRAEIELVNPEPGRPAVFEVALPSWSNPILSGVELSGGVLLPPEPEAGRRVYVALGDSLSHGTGQRSASF